MTIGSLIAEAKEHGFNPKNHASAVPLSAEQKAYARREREARDQAAAAETARAHDTAADQATKDWAAAQRQGQSRYLVKKQMQPHGVRFDDTIVLVPLCDVAGRLWNLQRIHPNGSKRSPEGGRVSGCFHVLGELASAKWVLFAEGYATAATSYEANERPVVVCFKEGNLRNVAKVARLLAPDANLLFCADDNQETKATKRKNPGIVSAQKAAATAGGTWCKPEGLPLGRTDFNDLAELRGKAEVKAQILAAREGVTSSRPCDGIRCSASVPESTRCQDKPRGKDSTNAAGYRPQALRYATQGEHRRTDGSRRPSWPPILQR